METELTKAIKKATHHYSPKMGNMRTIRYADEVKTPGGIVDSVRFEDQNTGKASCRKRYDDTTCPYPERRKNECRACVLRHMDFNIRMLITCYEVKITMEDFHSPNGHNFYGNENYYCVPKEMADKVMKEIQNKPEIGVLAWTGTGLRRVKQAEYREIPESWKITLLYNALKKWCDGAQLCD